MHFYIRASRVKGFSTRELCLEAHVLAFNKVLILCTLCLAPCSALSVTPSFV